MKKIYLTFFILITLLPALSYAQGQKDTLPLTTQQIIRALVKSLDSTYTKPQVDSITNLLIQSVNTKTDTSATEDIAEDVFNNNIAGYASEEYAANRAWSSADSVMNKTADSLLLKLYADFTQYDEEAPDETVFLVFQEPNSGVIYRATLGAIKALLQEITGDTIDYTAAEVNAILGSLSGGTISQVLTKTSNTDYDFGWADATGGSEDTTHLVSFANVIGLQDTVDDLQEDIAGKEDALGFTPEDVSNKSIDTTLGASNTLYPSQNAVKTYVDNAIETINNEGDPRVPYMWVYLALDTIPSLTSFTPVTDAEQSTLTASNVIGVNDYDVSYVSVITGGTDAEYRTKTGETWSGWGTTTQLLKAVDSAQVRFTSSDEYETALACTLIIGGEDEIFTVTTVAEVLPDAPTGFEAEGGTSDTEIPMTWTDAVGDIDSVRIYEGSTNDTTAMTWIASVVQGAETYTRTGRTAETTYWYAVKSYDGTNESYFSNTDSATTTAGGGSSHVTDNLVYYFDDDDLSNGTISSWTDRISSLVWTAYGDPTMTDSGIVLDGNDGFRIVSAPSFTYPITIEYLVKVVSDSTGSEFLLSWYASPNTIVNKFTIGTFWISSQDTSQYGHILPMSQFVHIMMTKVAEERWIVYFNGEVVNPSGHSTGDALDNQQMAFSGVEAGYDFLDAGSIIRLVRVYSAALSESDVEQNYNSTSIQGKLPE